MFGSPGKICRVFSELCRFSFSFLSNSYLILGLFLLTIHLFLTKRHLTDDLYMEYNLKSLTEVNISCLLSTIWRSSRIFPPLHVLKACVLLPSRTLQPASINYTLRWSETVSQKPRNDWKGRKSKVLSGKMAWGYTYWAMAKKPRIHIQSPKCSPISPMPISGSRLWVILVPIWFLSWYVDADEANASLPVAAKRAGQLRKAAVPQLPVSS